MNDNTGTSNSGTTIEYVPPDGITTLFDSNGNVVGWAAPNNWSQFTFSTAEATDEEGTEIAERHWEGTLAIVGHPTSDRRYLIPDEISHRELPVPFMVQPATDEGHDGALVAGRIDKIQFFPLGKSSLRDEPEFEGVPDEATVVWAEGTLDGSEAAQLAERMIENGAGVSIDLPADRVALIDPETFEEIDESTVDLADVLGGKFLTGIGGKIAGVTVVTIGAFEQASVQIQDGQALVASAYGLRVLETDVLLSAVSTRWAAETLRTLVAAAELGKPSADVFQNPRFKRLTPLTIDGDRVYGHLADWSGCHTGFSDVCVPPFRSHSDYAFFNVGEIECDDGTTVPVGKLMFSMDGGKHADLDGRLSAADVSKHYDDSSKIGAYVRAGSDRFGTWLAGVLRPGLSDEEIQHLRANPPSGDWRPIPGQPGSELVAAFSVPIPGFPIPRSLVASAEEGLIIITGPLDLEEGPRTQLRRKRMLRKRAWAALGR